jgi:hypothetical protein
MTLSTGVITVTYRRVGADRGSPTPTLATFPGSAA